MKLDILGRRNNGFAYINSTSKYNKKHYDKRAMFSLSKEDYDFCLVRAKERNISLSEQIRTYITWGIEADK